MTNPSVQYTDYAINGLILRLAQPTQNLLALEYQGERWLDGGAAGAPLWQLLAVNNGGVRATIASSSAPVAVLHDGGLVLSWAGVTDAATGAGPFDVRVEIGPGGPEGATAWRIRVDNHAAEWTLWQVTFPELRGLAPSNDPEADRFFDSNGWGTEYAGWSKAAPFSKAYPRGWDCPMQFFGFTRGERTFYLGAHDPRLTSKEFRFSPHRGKDGAGAGYSVVNYPEGMTLPGNDLQVDYDIMVAVLPGDWYDAAQFYGGWARSQPWAVERPAPQQAYRPEDEPQVWETLMLEERSLEEWGARMERLAELLGVRLGIHFYHWHQVPFDTDYPDYFPACDGFRELVARVRRAGILAMPYINARLWDINAPSWPAHDAVRFAAKGAAQRLHPLTIEHFNEEYGSGQKLAPMCPTTEFWQDTVRDLCQRIVFELGCNGVYLDQVAAEGSKLCIDPSHGHPLGGGSFWAEGYRTMMRRVRETVGADVFLTTECNWEGAIADFDALLMWHSFGEGLIPLFPAVYSGVAMTFGCQFNASTIREDDGFIFAERMAMLFAWGAQLGWGDLSLLLDEGNELLLEYFVALARERGLHASTFRNGRMLRPPKVQMVRREVVDGISTEFNLISERAKVYASLWQPASGDGATVFLVNPTREALTLRVKITAAECAGKSVGQPLSGGVLPLAIDDVPAFEISLSPLSVVAVPVGS